MVMELAMPRAFSLRPPPPSPPLSVPAGMWEGGEVVWEGEGGSRSKPPKAALGATGSGGQDRDTRLYDII